MTGMGGSVFVICPLLKMTIGVPVAAVISSGAACPYGRQTGTAPLML